MQLSKQEMELLPSSAQAPAKPSWAEVSIIIIVYSRPVSRPAGRPSEKVSSWQASKFKI